MAKFRGRPTVKAKFAVVKKLRCATVIATMQVSRIITGDHPIVVHEGLVTLGRVVPEKAAKGMTASRGREAWRSFI